MKRLVLGSSMIAVVVGLNGCVASNTNTLDKSFEEYKTYNSHKAMAVAMDDVGRYAIGYSSDYSSQDRANQRAIKQCTDVNNKSEYKIKAKCKLYAINNDIILD